MDIPETVFTNFHISDHLQSFDSETDYIGLMISSVKYQDRWYHDGKRHNFLVHSSGQRRQKRYARKTMDTWRNWVRPKYMTTTEAISIEGTYTNRLRTPIPTPIPIKATPLPLYIPTQTWSQPAQTSWRPTHAWRRPIEAFSRPIYSQTIKTTPKTTTYRPVIEKRVRVQPGTIVMMNSTYLKENYILKGLAKTYHKALLMDYFGLSESEMDTMRMSVVAWGFSYQVRDRPPARPGFERLH